MANLKMGTVALLVSVTLLLQITSTGQVKGSRTSRQTKKQTLGTKTQAKPSPSSTGGQTEDKNPFVSEEGRFSVMLPPGFPALEKTEQTAITPFGEAITLVTYQGDFKSKNGLNNCVITYVDYPDRIFTQSTPTHLIETAQRGTLGFYAKGAAAPANNSVAANK